MIFVALLITWLAVACGGGTDSKSTALAGSERQIKNDSTPGCVDSENFEKLRSYADQKDEKAFKSALAGGLADGTCTLFKAEETVFIMEVKALSGVMQVRRKGETQEFWVNIDAVRS